MEKTVHSTLKEYDQLLAAHDWYFAFSDDHGVFMRGERQADRLVDISKISDDHAKLLHAWSKHHYTGKPWNTEPFTKEQLDEVRTNLGVA